MIVQQRKPDWLRVRAPSGENYHHIKTRLRELGLHTVCEEANCPNIAECWGGGTATIMLMGDTCTRGCRFCNVKTGNPGGVLDPMEPTKVAAMLAELGLTYVVITSVDRDDLPDGGAGHFANTIREVRRRCPDMLIEVLIPDFQGDVDALRQVVVAGPDVIAQNIETVERLTHRVRDPRAGYWQTLGVLRNIKKLTPIVYSKSSIMLGLGETEDEVLRTMFHLRQVGCDILTLGQYLRPAKRHLPVQEYVPPHRYDYLRRRGEEMGFRFVAAGPLVRSSYKAGEFFLQNLIRQDHPSPTPNAVTEASVLLPMASPLVIGDVGGVYGNGFQGCRG